MKRLFNAISAVFDVCIKNYGFYKYVTISTKYYDENSNHCIYLDDKFTPFSRCKFIYLDYFDDKTHTTAGKVLRNNGVRCRLVSSKPVIKDLNGAYLLVVLEIKYDDINKFKESMNHVYRRAPWLGATSYNELCKEFIWPLCKEVNDTIDDLKGENNELVDFR